MAEEDEDSEPSSDEEDNDEGMEIGRISSLV